MASFLQPVAPVMGASETVSSVTATPSVVIGTEWGDANGNKYIYAYNASNSQISQGQYAVLATNVSGYSVTVTATTLQDCAVGVARNATLTTGTYGWLMTKGFSPISTDNVSGVTNQALALGSNGNFQVLTSTAGSFSTSTIIGKLLVSVATGVTATPAAYLTFY
jgi:hypothetical protein